MREIKFRAWNKNDNKMFNWSFTEQGIEPVDFFNNDNYFVMQYTGLKDRNGVAEVYEGDIIDTYGNIKGNIYEMDKRETDLVIQGFGTSSWEATNKEAMARGLKYSE